MLILMPERITSSNPEVVPWGLHEVPDPVFPNPTSL